jgi:hypothetical protein
VISKLSTGSKNMFIPQPQQPHVTTKNGIFNVEVKVAHQKLYRWGDELVVLVVKKKKELIDDLEIDYQPGHQLSMNDQKPIPIERSFISKQQSSSTNADSKKYRGCKSRG